MKLEKRIVAACGMAFVTLLFGESVTSLLAPLLPQTLLITVMVIVILWWGAMWGVGFAKSEEPFRPIYAVTHSFAFALGGLSGFWTWYGSHVEKLSPDMVDHQAMIILLIAMVIALLNEVSGEIMSWLARKNSKTKTAS